VRDVAGGSEREREKERERERESEREGESARARELHLAAVFASGMSLVLAGLYVCWYLVGVCTPPHDRV
jgi:hypothetical protein